MLIIYPSMCNSKCMQSANFTKRNYSPLRSSPSFSILLTSVGDPGLVPSVESVSTLIPRPSGLPFLTTPLSCITLSNGLVGLLTGCRYGWIGEGPGEPRRGLDPSLLRNHGSGDPCGVSRLDRGLDAPSNSYPFLWSYSYGVSDPYLSFPCP